MTASTKRRPAATLANGLDTLARIVGPDRLLVTVGAGDEESREENESFGLGFGTTDDRVEALRAGVMGCRDRGYPVWAAGVDPRVREVAAEIRRGATQAYSTAWNEGQRDRLIALHERGQRALQPDEASNRGRFGGLRRAGRVATKRSGHLSHP